MGWGKALRDRIYRSPGVKTAISIFTSVLGGIFSNTLVTEISTPKGIAWASFYSTFSFWALLLVCIVTFLFHRFLHAFETEISAFKDDDFCMAYARSQLIPAQVEASRQAINRGEVEQFKAAMKQIKDVLK
ncbi:hypothetical protein [Sinorhizobium sp. M4_45]|uniref:hypothetical protein n=1 Tax=Sinorhizobium sp. M4_45 TaxID=2037901 RepID=UPI000C9CF9B9|nr:hypothetical protein [Sinorhizobium sp. M4_45]PND26782.1 hypothetical protein CN933_13630 [Sinorhizobium sp. M4_45]